MRRLHAMFALTFGGLALINAGMWLGMLLRRIAA